MKNKIAVRLMLYFSSALLLFSLVIGGVFMTLFKQHTIQVNKDDLEKRAVTIAQTLSNYMSGATTGPGNNGMMHGGQGGYGAYLRLIDEIAMTDVWIVDENLQLITAGHMSQPAYLYADLPPDAESVVKEVFSGTTTFSEGFSDLINTPTLTIGTPIKLNDMVVGALLLHSPVEGMQEAAGQGFQILIVSIVTALLLAMLLSALLALSFTKPLKKMQKSAMRLADGDYTAKTEVKQQDEIGELAGAIDVLSERLDLAKRESDRLDQLRRDFVANISHELRTPVTVIRGSLEALCDEVVTEPEQVKHYHRQMLMESLFLQRLVTDLLDLSRLQNTDFAIEMHPLNLCDVVNDAVRSAGQMALKKEVTIQLEQNEPIVTVQGDYGRLRQMLMIILDNAIKFSPHGDTVTVLLKDRTVKICDHGAGISPDDLLHIFDRFYKTKSQENKTGSGLGLAIANQIAQRHGIKISVQSKLHEETCFTFAF